MKGKEGIERTVPAEQYSRHMHFPFSVRKAKPSLSR
jgi:hypothetical protein